MYDKLWQASVLFDIQITGHNAILKKNNLKQTTLKVVIDADVSGHGLAPLVECRMSLYWPIK